MNLPPSPRRPPLHSESLAHSPPPCSRPPPSSSPAGSRRLEEILPPWAVLKRMDPSRPLAEQVRNARVLIPTTGMVGAADIAAAADLRLVAQPAAGYNNIDVAAAVRRGVPVTIAPGYNSHSVAEVALVMILMLSRRVDEARAVFGRREPIGGPVGHELHGKRLGIVGMGRVGGCLAEAARGLGMEVLGVTSTSPRADLEALLAASHVVSLHCPLTPATAGLIGATELALMRPGAILINCARGSVLQRDALWAALQSGKLRGVGLDTHWAEPAPTDDPLYGHPAVLALPHLGSISAEVYERFAGILADNIVRCKEGRELLHRLA
ncbi:Glyoxylate reductase [Tetrabaena socialis]|uniref:Glyoxylate reductase n=1 Tax=Tetrabaena socialis TaxID=47790 RepID=A0A2J8A0Q5_9CHLO|nr:Glyoxylate reductase [Tetrabaena socialis]|eukprot:PNH06099.1 Glyoxylate reductase [Tetrabaena socialis]